MQVMLATGFGGYVLRESTEGSATYAQDRCRKAAYEKHLESEKTEE